MPKPPTVVGVPLEDVGGAVDAGGVAVINLRTSPLRNQFFTRATAGIDGDPTAGDQFGYAVATTDFDGDGFDDLASARLTRMSTASPTRARCTSSTVRRTGW